MESVSRSNYETFPVFFESGFSPRIGSGVCALLPLSPGITTKYFHGNYDIAFHLACSTRADIS